ncbi:FAD-binding protein [Bradyrhizobium sp. Arg314]
MGADRAELSAAKIIISGGRALDFLERFQEVILSVADKVGAAVGASRAAVDAGYAPNDWQGGCAGSLHRCRYLRRYPASRRYQGFEGHRRHQQGRRSTDLPGCRLRPGWRPFHDIAEISKGTLGQVGSGL